MDEKETEQFGRIRDALGACLLALNWDNWTEDERIALLRCVDCLARALIDMKRDDKGERKC